MEPRMEQEYGSLDWNDGWLVGFQSSSKRLEILAGSAAVRTSFEISSEPRSRSEFQNKNQVTDIIKSDNCGPWPWSLQICERDANITGFQQKAEVVISEKGLVIKV